MINKQQGGGVRCPFFVNVIVNEKTKKTKIKSGIPQIFINFLKDKKRVSYVTCDGSITMEAAFVMPLCILAVITIIQIMIMMNIQVTIAHSLSNQAEKISGYTYLSDYVIENVTDKLGIEEIGYVGHIIENGVTGFIVKKMVEQDVGKKLFINGYVDNVDVVITPFVSENYLDIIFYYHIRPGINFFNVVSVPIIARARVRCFNGTTRILSDDGNEGESGSEEVYVTGAGSVYHWYDDCVYIKVNLNRIKKDELSTVRNQSGGIYYPCPGCAKASNSSEYIYITRYGDRYHTDKKCKYVTHSVNKILFSDVGNRKECSKCRDRRTGEKKE